ncbi:ricin-type beta-trefoil lectin domain protein [Actinacidiphila sp. bgisy167]|uniref:ricin-type beta-trefoil lectin domain protein n=1 Tax=Actinacidiphila sp. bgisy167 TaxID=3413797 RepID=UPI003D72DFE6
MHRRARRVSPSFCGATLLIAAALAVSPALGSQAHAAARSVPAAGAATAAAQEVPTAGAATPFVTVEAESGTLGGGARIRDLVPGDPVPTVATLETEASGYALAELKSTGDSVTIRNSSGKQANTLVVRASIPDAATGGGSTATLDLYVDGVYRQAITLSSVQAWNYRNPGTNPNQDDPNAGGTAFHFYNDFPVWVTGSPIPANSTITLRKNSANTAAVYDVDSVDLEDVGPALTQPAGSLSVVSYGADPTFTKDSTAAIQNTVDAARTQGKPVWIPAGKYLTNSLTSFSLDFTGVTVQGAGMWYTTLYRKVPLPTPAGWRSQLLVGSGTTLNDIQIDGNAVWRGAGGGADYGVKASGALGWHVNRIWTRHIQANWLSGSNGLMENSRSSDSYADGFNINNSNNADWRGDNVTVRNCFARGTGDDAFATFADSVEGTLQLDGAKILNNTAVAPWGANGIRVAGGKNVQVMNNLVNSVSQISAMEIGIYSEHGQPLESATISGNVLIGGGGWSGVGYGARIFSPGSSSLFPNAYTNVTMTNNVLRGALRGAVLIDRTHVNVTFQGNTIDNPGEHGIRVNSGVIGTGTFSDNVAQNLRSGAYAFVNGSLDFSPTLGSNNWQNSSPVVNDDALAYDGSWVHAVNRIDGDLNNDVHHTLTPGAVAAYTFTGTGIRYLSERNGDEGTVDVYIDGVFQKTVDLKVSGPRQVQQVVFEKTGLSNGQHTFKLVNGSGLGMIDSLYIIGADGGTPTPDPTPSPVVNDDALTYGSGWSWARNRIDGDLNDDVHYSVIPGAVATYTFNGTGIRYLSERNVDEGTVDVYIDGVFQSTVNLKISGPRQVQQVVFEKTGLSNGQHTFKLVNGSGLGMIDSLYIITSSGGSGGGGTTAPTGRITGYGGKCVDVAGGSSANGTAVQLYDCNSTAAQKWTMAADGSVQALGKCINLTASGTANGTKAELRDCNGGASQKWTYNSSSRALVNPQSGRCLDATGPSSANGTRLQIWDCAGSSNQQWTVPAA